MIYSPAEDSYLLQKYVNKYSKNKTVLDIGSGSGIQAETALNSKAKSVLATDINPESIKLLRSKKINAINSNLFTKVKGKFDLIIFNPPYLPLDKREDKESQLATTGGKNGDEIIVKFIKQSKSHLTDKGIILLLLSSLTPKDKILQLIKNQKMTYKIIGSEKVFFETLEVWKISNIR
jgi:release factor glutamine methyltransferase